MRFLVTGGAGFIGSNIAKALAADPANDVVAADSFLSATWRNLVDFPGDVLTLKDSEDVASILSAGPYDAIFHQASITGVIASDGSASVTNEVRMLRNNVETFRALLDHAVATKARMIYASSCSIYGRNPTPMRESQTPDPLNIYAFSKLSMERLAKKYAPKLSHPIIGLRYSNVYGPGEEHKGKLASMIHQLAKQMRSGTRPRIFRSGQQTRDFVYIADVVQANLNSLHAKESGSFNVGAGQSWSFNQVVAELNRVLKTNLEPDYFENPYGFTQDNTQVDLTLSSRILNYHPQHDLKSGIDAYQASGKLGIAS
ncbi:MAG TPA: NAD-dependent epimerase/dehydratase family protein [Tepidisphaeraceae bacterium]|jgi:ADP-L-glycero-D-manno-heptose 6-epimerase|nr:NAD-dependent epimerase/dehydratase family protein [Tepidisphaeraceae bacterium]